MTIKLILVPVTGTDDDGVVLEAALTLASRFSAHMEVLHAQLDPRDAVPFLGEGASGALIQQIMEAAQRDSASRTTRARANFETWRQRHSVPLAAPGVASGATVSWREDVGAEDEVVGRRGRLADLIVVRQPSSQGNIVPTVSFEAALLDTGRPVIAVPASGMTARVGEGPVLVAWNGSVESARAIWAAIPLLAQAPRVSILSVLEDDKAADGGKVVEYLAWHGVKAEQLPTARKQANVGAQILAETSGLGAGMLVMGAYTRSRLRRMVFGGVTEHVLTNATIPAFMMH
ncbi:MAG TPA: universal stress protein [Alphaproteobacteria bacterium]|nr:universal stress protein [Alphaproteobacteria bacterium]